MKIAVNLRQYYKGKIGGMENYVRNVIGGLRGHRLTIWVHDEETAHVREFAPEAEIVGISHQHGLATIEQGVKNGDFDLFFCPLLVLEPLVVDKPSAVMMPDVQHEFFPEFFDKNVLQWRRQTYGPSALNTDVLFTLSEHAKSTIIDKFQIPPEKIRVIHLDADPQFHQPLPSSPSAGFHKLKLPGRYLYFPANFWPHKNHSNVLQALRQVDPNCHLVLSGSSDGWDRVQKEAAELGLKERVHFAGYIAKELIPEVYQHAAGLLFATKFEGFGIPLLEAFHCGCPAITSNAGSCVEVAGNAAIFVDPLDPASIAAGIKKLLTATPESRAELIAAGLERAKLFSWQSAVDLTEQAFQYVTSANYTRPSPIHVDEWPTIGIVTPTYKMAEFLEETIQSVLSQNYPKLDYVVMDAGSKDGTVEILQKYSDKLRWCSERDNGQADAINKGWHALSGQIFAYLNADDTYLPDTLPTIASHFRKNPGVGMIYGEAYHVAVDGKIIDRYPTQPFSLETLNNQCYICQPAAFLLRDAFARAGFMNVEMHFALDYELWIRVAKQYGVLKVDEYFATSRMHMDNKTLSSRKKVYQEIIGVVRDQYGYVPYEWLNGYACYLLDKKDQYFDRSKPSLTSYALSLALGVYHNPRNLQRYIAEWRKMTGFGGQFTDRWEDGWISKKYISEQPIDRDGEVLRIAGKHWAPIPSLRLRIELDGNRLPVEALTTAGPFSLELPVPKAFRGKKCRMVIEADQTWRPKENGDYRQLSCVIDSIQFEPARKEQ